MKSILKAGATKMHCSIIFTVLRFTAAFDNEDVAAGGVTWKHLKWTVSL